MKEINAKQYGEFVEIKQTDYTSDDRSERILGGEIWYN